MTLGAQAEQYLEAVEKLNTVNACVIGDLVLDRYVWGRVDRISPEAPVPVVHRKKTEDRLGCAGNAALNLRQLGVDVSLCSINIVACNNTFELFDLIVYQCNLVS